MEIFKLFGSVFVKTEDAEKSISRTEEKAESFAAKLGKGISKAVKWSGAITTATASVMTAFGTASVKSASEAETAFAKVKTLISGTDEEMQKYYDDILKGSNEAGVSFEDFSEAVYSAISASVDQADAVSFTTQAIQLAKAGFTDASTAVDVMTTAINAYGLSAKDATHISDALITTQNLGKTTVDELASSMGKVIPLASAYNVDIDNLTASYAQLTKGGIATAEATTYMKGMFTELAKEGSGVSEILKDKTGKSFSELMQSGMSLGEVLGIIYDSVEGDSTAFAGLWSSTEAGTGALALVGAGVEEFNETLGAMRDSTDATTTAYGTVTDTLASKIEKIKVIFSNISTQMGNVLLPIVEKVADHIIQAMPTIQGIIEGLLPVMTMLFDGLLPPLLELTESIFPILVELVNALLPPVVSIVQTLLPVLVSLFEPLLPLIQMAAGLLSPLVEIVVAFLQPLTMLMDGILQPIIAHLSSLASTVSEVVVPVLKKISEVVKTVLNPAFSDMKNVLKPVLDFISTAFKAVYETVGGVITKMASGIRQAFDGIRDKVTTAVTAVRDVIKNVFGSIAGIVKAPVNALITIINKMIGALNALSFDVPDWVPIIGGENFGFHLKEIPLLERGGVLKKGQRGFLEGNGAEAVVPLDQNRKWISAVAENMDQETGNSTLWNRVMELLTEIVRLLQPDTVNETIIPIYIGNDRLIDELVVEARNNIKVRSGGWSDA